MPRLCGGGLRRAGDSRIRIEKRQETCPVVPNLLPKVESAANRLAGYAISESELVQMTLGA